MKEKNKNSKEPNVTEISKEEKQIYQMTFNETQLQIMAAALEEYFRVRAGQFEMLTEDLLERRFGGISSDNIDSYCEMREDINSLFQQGYRKAFPVNVVASEEQRIALDIEHVLNHQRWLDSGIKTKEDYTIHAHKPMQFSSEELPVLKNVDKTNPEFVYRPRIEAYASSGNTGISYRRWHEADILEEDKVKNDGTYRTFKAALTSARKLAKEIEKGKYDDLLKDVYDRCEFGNIQLQACVECHDAYSFEQVNVIPVKADSCLCNFCRLKDSANCPCKKEERKKMACKGFGMKE